MTSETQAVVRADLFRVACRFASEARGVRIEPAAGGGAILSAWGPNVVFVVRDATGVCRSPLALRVPRDFIDSVSRAIRTNGAGLQVRVIGGDVLCDGVSIAAPNAVAEAPPDSWRPWVLSAPFEPLAGDIQFRRDLMDTIADAAMHLARAAGRAPSQAERCLIAARGEWDGAIVFVFEDFPDAFLLLPEGTPETERQPWRAPSWLATPAQARGAAQC